MKIEEGKKKQHLSGHQLNPISHTVSRNCRQMGRSGKVNREEPTDISCIEKLPGHVELFQQDGWLDFFKRIDGYNSEVSHQFAKGYK